LKLHTRGKPIPVAELPTPPGFSPIPVADISTTSTNVSNDSNIPDSSIKIKNDQMISSTTIKEPVNKTSARPSVAKQKSMTLQEKQLLLLQKRQSMFKSAALEAKRAGQIEQAKEYLRSAKGFDKLIEAAKGGLPVDITTLPVPPQAVTNIDMGFTIISKEEGMHISEDLDNKSRQEMYLKLEADIKAQIIMCETNEKHFKMTGDIASANKFQQMSEHTKKDLDALRFAYKRGDPVPKFHYEVRAFSIIVCNTDLTDHEAELTLERGINYNVPNPKEVHTYCRIEFPYPKDAPFKDKTATVKDTNNPEYNHKIMIPVNIKEKTCQRVFKRAAAKIEVWSKGGFLRGDTMLGTASVKLAPLETACTLHDTFPLMDGRKAVGGKVEVQTK
jgi:coiled-coil and C2 domain-containing protein 1